ncbi:hypothetical protein [Kitasatospora sp. NPDC006786]|uniref:hypothetical protein n=1 Tax=unclassified Kitasatospora TaxID=2633591 RepID=UPI00340E796C
MTTVEKALRAETTRLRLDPQIERAARDTLATVLASGYNHRPQRESDLSAEQYRDRLVPEAVAAVFTYTALHLSSQYGRAAAHLLHTLNSALSGPAPSRPAARSQTQARRPRGGLFHDAPGLADTMVGLETDVTAAAEHLNGLDFEHAEDVTLAIAARLADGGSISRTYATTIARHLVETQAQHLADGG